MNWRILEFFFITNIFVGNKIFISQKLIIQHLDTQMNVFCPRLHIIAKLLLCISAVLEIWIFCFADFQSIFGSRFKLHSKTCFFVAWWFSRLDVSRSFWLLQEIHKRKLLSTWWSGQLLYILMVPPCGGKTFTRHDLYIWVRVIYLPSYLNVCTHKTLKV